MLTEEVMILIRPTRAEKANRLHVRKSDPRRR